MDTINNPNMMMQTPPRRSSLGPVIGIILILAVIVVGSLYFWGQRMETMMQQYPQTTQTQNQNASTSDDIDSIEQDLNATSFTNIDAGVEELQ